MCQFSCPYDQPVGYAWAPMSHPQVKHCKSYQCDKETDFQEVDFQDLISSEGGFAAPGCGVWHVIPWTKNKGQDQANEHRDKSVKFTVPENLDVEDDDEDAKVDEKDTTKKGRTICPGTPWKIPGAKNSCHGNRPHTTIKINGVDINDKLPDHVDHYDGKLTFGPCAAGQSFTITLDAGEAVIVTGIHSFLIQSWAFVSIESNHVTVVL